MAKKNNFYGVKIGRVPGIYTTWDECKEQVDGFNGAKYHGFVTREEAEKYINGDEQEESISSEVRKEVITIDYDALVSEKLKEKRIVAFTDGGYSGKNQMYGYGVYILEPQGSSPIEISDIVRTDKFSSSNNIGPEVMAVITALDWALSNGYEKIAVFHDYEGIGKWANGEYKAKAGISKWFVEKLSNDYNDVLDIVFVWVPGHNGIFYNEEADRLATEAINRNIKPQFKMSETYFSCINVCEKDVKEIIEKISDSPDIDLGVVSEEHNKVIYGLKSGKEKLTINFYRKNSKTLVQGKPNSLFSLFLSFYTEKIPDFELVIAYGKMRKQRIEVSVVNSMTNKLNLPSDFPEDAIKFIKQAIAEKISLTNGKNKEIFDYGHYIFPACRALEGCIKYLFEKCGTHIASNNTIGGYFGLNDNNTYFLKGNRYGETQYKYQIERAYNVYHSNRNALGHFGELLCNDENDTTTMMIENAKDAIDVIDDILDTIKFD